MNSCAVCGNLSNFKFYSVKSCGGCKQFFRRIIIKRAEFFCMQQGKCDFKQNKCRGCRLDQCLYAGMSPYCVRTAQTDQFRHFVKRIEKRRKEVLSRREEEKKGDQLNNRQMNSSISDANLEIPSSMNIPKNAIIGKNMDWELFSHFRGLICAQKRVWERFHDVSSEYLTKFDSIQEVLEGTENLLGFPFLSNAAKPNCNSPNLGMEIFFEGENQMKNLKKPPNWDDGLGVAMLMDLGILKAMPAFKNLEFYDKMIIARELCQPIHCFTKMFYSLRNGSKIMAGKNGRSLHFCRKYKNDPQLMNLAEKAFIRPMDAFYRIPILKQEEYALLMAILCSNSTMSGLSDEVRNLLAEEQCRLSKLLMKYLQMNLGGFEGARRYAECIQLLDNAFNATRHFELIQTYIGAFHQASDFFEGVYPKCLKAIVK